MTTMAWQEQLRPGVALREIVQEATAALIAMDAERLEELARCCVDLNREINESGEIAETASGLREAASDVKLLGYVLMETRANLTVLSRLRAIRLREAESAREERFFERAAGKRPGLSLERTSGYGDN